jgi:hypothetical protein
MRTSVRNKVEFTQVYSLQNIYFCLTTELYYAIMILSDTLEVYPYLPLVLFMNNLHFTFCLL